MAVGVFDLLHTGHLHYFRQAADHGDELVVVVACDASVQERKHPPILPEQMRLELVDALAVVDRAVLGDEEDHFATVERVDPDVIALGFDDYHDTEDVESECSERGLDVDVVRASEHDDDLAGTRRIVRRILTEDAYREYAGLVEGGDPMTARIGVADTTFARIDLGQAAIDRLRTYAAENDVEIDIVRRTVPGFKDLPVAAKQLVEEDGADLVLALGQAGPEDIDKQCAHEASQGLQRAQLATNTHILEVFVHTDEADDPGRLRWLGENRAREHALNACHLLFEPETLTEMAGTGQREGFTDAGPITAKPDPPSEEA